MSRKNKVDKNEIETWELTTGGKKICYKRMHNENATDTGLCAKQGICCIIKSVVDRWTTERTERFLSDLDL